MNAASVPFVSFQRFYTTAEIEEMLYPSPPATIHSGPPMEWPPGTYRVIDDELYLVVHGIPVCHWKDGAR